MSNKRAFSVNKRKNSDQQKNSSNINKDINSTNKKIIENEDQLSKLINEERKKARTKTSSSTSTTTQKIPSKKIGSEVVLIDGSNVANYGTRGYPSFNPILNMMSAAIKYGFQRIIVIVDANLRYLLVEHEKIPNLDACTCLFCSASENQYIIRDSKKITFLECMPHTDADEMILEMASSAGAKIITNDNYTEFTDQFLFLSSKEWQIKYEIDDNQVLLKSS